MGDWERKDPDEEFAWRDRKATVVQTLLDKLMEDDGIEHDDEQYDPLEHTTVNDLP